MKIKLNNQKKKKSKKNKEMNRRNKKLHMIAIKNGSFYPWFYSH